MLTVEQGHQGPLKPELARDPMRRLRIVSHPALRLGFLDAQNGRPLDHDNIIKRIMAETPPTSLKCLGWDRELFSQKDVEKSQYRYEEGRLLVIKYGLRCKGWNHPDYPPAAVRNFALHRPDEEPL